MLVFNNQQRSGYEEIVSYGPKFYTSIKEMDAIYRFAGWTLDFMAADLEKLVTYQFIGYMDDATLTRFEHFLGISYDESKTLAARKTLAYANWSSSGKMSKTKIIKIVNTFAECDCEVSLVNSVLCVNMTFGNNPAQYMKDIRNLIRKVIPAHIEILYKGKVDTNIIFVWTNKVTVERMVNKMTFHIHGAKTVMTLDGSAFLDGSLFLDNSFNLYPFRIKNILEMAHFEKFIVGTGSTIEIMNNHSTAQNMRLRTHFTTKESVPYALTHKIGITHAEKVTSSVTIKNDLCYLDGSELLNGSRKVDAYIKKEDL